MIRILLFVFALTVSAQAQDCVFSGPPSPASPNHTSAFFVETGSGSTNFRYQILVSGQVFQGVPTFIRDLFVAVPAGWKQVRYESLTIAIGQTTANALNASFASNVTGPMQTVLHVDDHVKQYGPGPVWSSLGLQEGFWFNPALGNLLVDVVALGTTSLGGLYFDDLAASNSGTPLGVRASWSAAPPVSGIGQVNVPVLRFCTNAATATALGQGCDGVGQAAPVLGLTGLPTLGGQSTFWLSTTVPNGLALLAFGETAAPPFPVDLGILGATGCQQYFSVTSLVGVTTNSFGIGSHTVSVPNQTALVGFIVLGQFAALAPGANSLNILTSNYGRIQVGL